MEKRTGNNSKSKDYNDRICPKEFLMSWNLDALEVTRIKTLNEPEMLGDISKRMGISEDIVKELSEVCGKQSLLVGTEPKSRLRLLEMKSIPPEVDLESVKYQVEERQTRSENDSHRLAVVRHMKYNVMDEYMAIVPSDLRVPVDDYEHRVPVPNLILTIQVVKCLYQGDTAQKSRESETFQVLGSQPLSALRDKITCSSDGVIPGDYSSMPDTDPHSLQKSGDLYKSSFFFIEDIFYNDLRLVDNKDYSKPIMKWAEEHCPGTNFTTATMEDVIFNDLTIRLGHHYLFSHQGSCEHSVTFTDMRLFTSEDIQDMRHYPVLSVTRMKNRSVCQGCSKLSAKWIVQDSPLIPTDPCFLCKLCFKTLLYNKQGQKMSDFKAYIFSEFYTV